MDEAFVPQGWQRYLRNGRVVFSPPVLPHQRPLVIYSRGELSEYQKKGKFLDIDVDQLVFARKRKQKQKNFVTEKKDPSPEALTAINPVVFDPEKDIDEKGVDIDDVLEYNDNLKSDDNTNDQVDSELTSGERKKLDREHQKLTEAISKLTIDPSRRVVHSEVLENAAKKLNDARAKNARKEEDVEVESLKDLIKDCQSLHEVTKVIWKDSGFQKRFSHLFTSQLLEQLLSLGSFEENPLKSFPVDVNSNIYSDIMNFALENARDVMLLLTALTKKQENPICPKDVIQLAYSFSSLAEAANSQNNSLKKVKSLGLRSTGLTNSGLDSLSQIGVSETSRSARNDRDVLASISEEIVKQHAKNNVPQYTFDNLDIRINNITHHLTLNFKEFEQNDTSDLSTNAKPVEELLDFFTKETLLLQSVENTDLFVHYQYVTALTLGRLFGKEVDGMAWLLSVFPEHYVHPNSPNAANKAIIHVDKPMYAQETKNSDMFRIMKSLQLQYLNLIGEQVAEKDEYYKDIKTILSAESPADIREAAEIRVKLEEKKAGVLICHGDQLTKERFESCKRLAQSGVSAVERFEFMPVFRIGMFHLRMNKSIMDIESGMKGLVNVEDELSLGYFRTVLGLNSITNKAENIKRCGEFEKHDQFLLVVGKEILINAFKSFMASYKGTITKTTEGATDLILKFLSVSDIKYFYDPNNFDEKDKFDDILSSCRDNAGRTVLSMVSDKVEHEGDGLGIRAVRKAMIPYFLNKKVVQSSKYAMSLLSDLVNYMGASERTKKRIDLLATCNPTGGLGKCLARDQVNEHKVKMVKNSIRGLHSQLSDTILSKTVLGANVLCQLQEHDQESMLLPMSGGRSSYSYIGDDQRSKIRSEIEKINPFDQNREKREHYEKPTGSVFAGLSLDRVEKFLTRNKQNFTRSYPHKRSS